MAKPTKSTAADGTDPAPEEADSPEFQELATKAVAVGVICVGAALVEVGLIPGMVIGVAAAVLAPKFVPQIGAALHPVFRSFVRGAYKLGRKAQETVAEAKEQVHDIVAEVHAEDHSKNPPAETSTSSRT